MQKDTLPLRLLYVVTHPMTACILLKGQMTFLQANGFEVAVAAAPGPELEMVASTEGISAFPIPLRREISPVRDLRGCAALARAIREFRPDIVNASTPKAGFLGMLVARWADVPVRVYTLRGLRLETTRGVKRLILRASERIASACAHRVICVSESLLARYNELNLAPSSKLSILGKGSSTGVDLNRYRPAQPNEDLLQAFRSELELDDSSPVIGFVGRLTRDKGIEDLAEAFLGKILDQKPDTRLLLVGKHESGDEVSGEVLSSLTDHPQVRMTGWVPDTAPYYRLMGVLALPSYREGFPNAPLEAAASGVPTVGYRVTGTVDAVEEGTTGRLIAAGDRAALARSLLEYLENPELRRNHGQAGRRRVEADFAQESVWADWLTEYRQLYQEFDASQPAATGKLEN